MTTLSDADLFGRTLPVHPSRRPLRRPCAVCQLPYDRALDAGHHLCPLCLEDLSKSEETARTCLAAVERRIEAHHERWAARLAALDDNLAERWTRLHAARAAAEAAVERLLRGRVGHSFTKEAQEQALAEARAKLKAVQAKIARTAAQPGNPLAPLIQEEAVWMRELGALLDERNRWTIALQECEAARDALPF